MACAHSLQTHQLRHLYAVNGYSHLMKVNWLGRVAMSMVTKMYCSQLCVHAQVRHWQLELTSRELVDKRQRLWLGGRHFDKNA